MSADYNELSSTTAAEWDYFKDEGSQTVWSTDCRSWDFQQIYSHPPIFSQVPLCSSCKNCTVFLFSGSWCFYSFTTDLSFTSVVTDTGALGCHALHPFYTELWPTIQLHLLHFINTLGNKNPTPCHTANLTVSCLMAARSYEQRILQNVARCRKTSWSSF